MALAATTRERVYLVQLLNGMNNGCGYTPVTVDEDNQGATALSKNPVCRQRGKHVDIKYHFVRCALCDGKKTIDNWTINESNCHHIYCLVYFTRSQDVTSAAPSGPLQISSVCP